MAVMQQLVEHRADRGDVAQQFAPVFHWTVCEIPTGTKDLYHIAASNSGL